MPVCAYCQAMALTILFSFEESLESPSKPNTNRQEKSGRGQYNLKMILHCALSEGRNSERPLNKKIQTEFPPSIYTFPVLPLSSDHFIQSRSLTAATHRCGRWTQFKLDRERKRENKPWSSCVWQWKQQIGKMLTHSLKHTLLSLTHTQCSYIVSIYSFDKLLSVR